jgi:hypothetical protein
MYIEICLHRNAPEDRPVSGLSLMQLPMIPVTVVLYFIALFSALRLRTIDWRGIQYDILQGGAVRRRNYKPWTGDSNDSGNSQSII